MNSKSLCSIFYPTKKTKRTKREVAEILKKNGFKKIIMAEYHISKKLIVPAAICVVKKEPKKSVVSRCLKELGF